MPKRTVLLLCSLSTLLVANDAHAQEPTPPPAPAPEAPGVRFGVFAGGLAFPGLPATAVAGGVTAVLPKIVSAMETRLVGLAYFVEDDFTKTTGGAVLAQLTRW